MATKINPARRQATPAECLTFERDALNALDYPSAWIAGYGAGIAIASLARGNRGLNDVRAALDAGGTGFSGVSVPGKGAERKRITRKEARIAVLRWIRDDEGKAEYMHGEPH